MRAQALADHRAHLVGRPLADRAGDHAGLAEAAAPGAAPEDLDVEPVVDDLGERDQLVAGVGPLGEVGDRALLDALGHVGVAGPHLADEGALVVDLVHRRHVDALDVAQLAQHRLAGALAAARRLPLPQHDRDVGHDLFPVAQHDEVEEVGQRLGVVGAVPARRHQRVLGTPLGRPHRHPGQVDGVEQVRIRQLGRQVERQHVELAGGTVRVDREQRDALAPHDRLEVGPRVVGPLGGGVVALVEDLVEDLQALVGQADLVGVGVGEQPRHEMPGMTRPLRAELQPDVACGLLHTE